MIDLINPRILLSLPICCLALVQAVHPAGSIGALGGSYSEEFGSTKVLYWDRSMGSPENGVLGGFAITYGRPLWKPSYAEREVFDRLTQGQTWRLGKAFWTVLDSNVPLVISGKEIAVGYHYLGVRRSPDGCRWSLAFIDPRKARRAHLDAFQIAQAPIDFQVPLQFHQADEQVDKLTVTLSYDSETPERVTLTVAWGTLRLSAPVVVRVATSP